MRVEASTAKCPRCGTNPFKAVGLEQTGEGREWHYHCQGKASPNNVIGLQLEIR